MKSVAYVDNTSLIVQETAEINFTFSKRSFTALESSGQLIATILISGESSDSFDLIAIPVAKHPLDILKV